MWSFHRHARGNVLIIDCDAHVSGGATLDFKALLPVVDGHIHSHHCGADMLF